MLCMEYYDAGILYITVFTTSLLASKGEMNMHTEIKELSRMICNQCEEKEYEKCKGCRVYQLVNKIAEQ